MSVIIIEGIDRVGKTTLANLIKRKFDAKVFKDKMLVADDMKDRTIITEKIATTVNMLKLWPADKMLVIDRFHLSEVVYGILDREYVNNDMRKIDDMLSEIKDIQLILVEPTDIEWSSNQHGSDLENHKKLFDLVYEESKIKDKIKCNYKDFDYVLKMLEAKKVFKWFD